MDGHAPANQLRLSLPGADRVKPERNLAAAKPPSAKGDPNPRPSRAQVTEPPYTDPYVRWCGRGGAVRLPPIPIFNDVGAQRAPLRPVYPIFSHPLSGGLDTPWVGTSVTGLEIPMFPFETSAQLVWFESFLCINVRNAASFQPVRKRVTRNRRHEQRLSGEEPTKVHKLTEVGKII